MELSHLKLSYLKLSCILLLACSVMPACSPKAAVRTSNNSEPVGPSYYRSQLAPANLFVETKNFLQWQKGYSIQLSENSRGIMVTSWMRNTPMLRHQLNIRVNRDADGSILTAHMNFEEYENGRWMKIQPARSHEQDLLQELETYLTSKQRVAK